MDNLTWKLIGEKCNELFTMEVNDVKSKETSEDIRFNLSKVEVERFLTPEANHFFVQVPAIELTESIISQLNNDCRIRIRSGNAPEELISWFFPTFSGLLKSTICLYYTEGGALKAVSHRIIAIDKVYSECGIFNSHVKLWPYN